MRAKVDDCEPTDRVDSSGASFSVFSTEERLAALDCLNDGGGGGARDDLSAAVCSVPF